MISVRNVPEFIEALGGLQGAANAFGVASPTVVWNWKRGGLPAWARLEAGRVAQANGIVLAAKITEPKRRKKAKAA